MVTPANTGVAIPKPKIKMTEAFIPLPFSYLCQAVATCALPDPTLPAETWTGETGQITC